jgi:glycerol uptake facilitator protein
MRQALCARRRLKSSWGVHGYFWVPIIGPLIGGVVGVLVYDFFIRDVLKARGEQPEPDVEPEGRTIKEVPKT